MDFNGDYHHLTHPKPIFSGDNTPEHSPSPNPETLTREKVLTHEPTDDVALARERQRVMQQRQKTWTDYGIPPASKNSLSKCGDSQSNVNLNKQVAESNVRNKKKSPRQSCPTTHSGSKASKLGIDVKVKNSSSKGKVSGYKPGKTTPIENGREASLEPAVGSPSNDQQVYLVEYVCGKKIVKGKTLYKIKWVGFPLSQSTWEPLENIGECKEHIQDFEENQKRRSGGKSASKSKNKKEISNKAETAREPEIVVSEQQKAPLVVVETSAEVPSTSRNKAKGVHDVVAKLSAKAEHQPPRAMYSRLSPKKTDSVSDVDLEEFVVQSCSKATETIAIEKPAVQPVAFVDDSEPDLIRLKSFAKKVIGIFMKDGEHCALVHFESGDKSFMKYYPLQSVAEHLNGKLMDFYLNITKKTVV